MRARFAAASPRDRRNALTGVETLRTKHGNDTPIEYDPHTGTSTAYQPNGQVLQQIQHDTDKNHPYRH